jgi:serine/threonine protein kinase
MHSSAPAPGDSSDQEINREAAERVGTVLNEKWTLERLIGVGGMASVYAARHRNGARAAVKLLHPEFSRHAEVRERFQREGYAANKVGHSGVVRVLDDDVIAAGPFAGSAYLVMELLEGESMQDRLERGPPIGEREFLEIAESVLEVLQVAHEQGVVHRDVKPENLFFAREGGETDATKTHVKVLDFGLARLREGQAITTYGLALGTPSFMSPEQAAGRLEEIDGRTDLFALAATGFRIRTGKRIHEADGPVELVTKMAHLPAPRIRTVAPDVSGPFARVIDRGLAFKRDDRYESAAAMRADVKRALDEISKAPQALSQRSPALPAQPKAQPADSTIELSERDLERPQVYGMDESVRIPKTRSIVPWLALLLIGGGGFAAWRHAPSEARLVALQWLSALKERGRSMLAPTASGVASAAPSDAPSASDRMGADAGAPRIRQDAGAPRAVSAGPPHPWSAPSAPSTHRPMPARRDAGTGPSDPRAR